MFLDGVSFSAIPLKNISNIPTYLFIVFQLQWLDYNNVIYTMRHHFVVDHLNWNIFTCKRGYLSSPHFDALKCN